MYLWLNSRQESLDTLMSWKPGVHKGVDVYLPRDIEYTLSLNLKYIFPIAERKTVAYEWFEEVVRKTKLRWFFRSKPLSNEGYDAVLPHTRNRTFNPPVNEQWFYQGEEVGRRLLALQLQRSIPKAPSTNDIFSRLIVPPKHLGRYLSGARLLSFISDKNLGIVITTRCWYEHQVRMFLDLPVFRPFPGNFMDFHHDTCEGLERLCRDRSGQLRSLFTPRTVKFLKECWLKRDIPFFHGIPKIHKNPWKLRPIVPMHSYVTSRLASLLHAMLLPVQRSFGWICESSRDLARDVARFNKRYQNTPTRLHTGDVSAMYTSITLANFRRALSGILEEGNWFDEATRSWILEAAEFLWNHTVFQVEGRLIKQTDGIPMGLHCAPVFANIYMAYFEKYYLRHTRLGDVSLYRRYLDDIFVLHPLDDDVESLRCPDLTINWQHSGVGLSFLDVWFHIHLGKSGVCFRPFEKVLNHHQYLPWASHHPLSVKKGMVKGELTRVRAICFEQSYFLTWKTTFLLRLKTRGWPLRVLKAWSRQVQWEEPNRVSPPSARQNSSLVAVSEYNPVWEKISPADIWQSMMTEWQRSAPEPLPFPSHTLVAKKRKRSLWDLLRSVNRNLLRKDLEEIDIEELSDAMSTLSSELPFAIP